MHPESTWPTWTHPPISEENLQAAEQEYLKTRQGPREITLMAGEGAQGKSPRNPFLDLTAHTSSLSRLVRITARVLKAVRLIVLNKLSLATHQNIKERHPWMKTLMAVSEKHIPTSRDHQLANNLLIKLVQQDNFPGDHPDPRVAKQVNNLFLQIGVVKDDTGILRCTGRRQSTLPAYDLPILLPRGTAYTRLVIEAAHHDLNHAGVSHTLAQPQQRFWILQGRAAVRSYSEQMCLMQESCRSSISCTQDVSSARSAYNKSKTV